MTSVESGKVVVAVKPRKITEIACPHVWRVMFEFLDINELEKCELVCSHWANDRYEDKHRGVDLQGKKVEALINPIRRFSSLNITRKYFGVDRDGNSMVIDYLHSPGFRAIAAALELRTVGLNGKARSLEITSFRSRLLGDEVVDNKNTLLDDLIDGEVGRITVHSFYRSDHNSRVFSEFGLKLFRFLGSNDKRVKVKEAPALWPAVNQGLHNYIVIV